MAFYDEEYDHSTFSYWLGWDPKGAFNIFATGYRRAAERLTKSLLRKRRFSSYEAYPVVFLYRQALELALKHAVYRAATFASYTGYDEIEDCLYNRHEFPPLVKAITRSLTLLFPRDRFVRSLLQRIRVTSRDLTALDSSSYIFRYPIDKTGSPAASSKSVNLRAFARHMSALLEDIDTLNFGLDAETDVAQEAFTAYAAYYSS